MFDEKKVRVFIDMFASLAESDSKETLEIVNGLSDENREYIRSYIKSGFSDFVSEIHECLEHIIACNDAFVYLHYDFIESHLTYLFKEFEGSIYSADKSNFIMQSLVEYLDNGVSFTIDYGQTYTYMLPKKILNTHAEMIGFYKAIKKLYYGRPIDYLQFLKKIAFKSTENNSVEDL